MDLAGSEMVKKTHATGERLEEAKTIVALSPRKRHQLSHGRQVDARALQGLKINAGAARASAATQRQRSLFAALPVATMNGDAFDTSIWQVRKAVQNKAKVNKERSPEEMKIHIDT